MKLSGKKVPETGNTIGNCAESKVATAAHKNSSPITGMDTRNRFGESNHPYSGADKTSNSQMDPCDTCKVYENENKKCK